MSKRKKSIREKPGQPFHEPPGPSSQDEPITGIESRQVACQLWRSTFDTKSEIERYERTTREALECHSYERQNLSP